MTLGSTGFVALVFLLGGTAAARAECRPAAIPIGDPVLVQTIVEKLIANGVMTAEIKGCPAVRVHLERRGEQLHLRVADGFQRRGERQVQDVATAAAVIESWTLQEIENGTLPELPAPAPAPSVATAVTPFASPERFSIAAAGHSSMATDATAWLGADISGCMRIGWSCIGVSTTLIANTETTQDASRGAQRSKELHTRVLFEIPRSVGSFTFRPGVAVGYGWMSLAQQHMDEQALPISAEPTTHSLQARGQLAMSRALHGRLAVQASVFADVAAVRTAIPDGPTTPPRARFGASIGLRVGL